MPPKKKTPAVYVPAHTQLKVHRTTLLNQACAINVPLGQIIHWLPLITRPVVPFDVQAKKDKFIECNGWLDSFNVMARVLSPEERVQLRQTLKDMAQEDGGAECEGHGLWQQSRFHIKVHPDKHTRTDPPTYTHIHAHTHTDSRTHRHAQTHTTTGQTHTRTHTHRSERPSS